MAQSEELEIDQGSDFTVELDVRNPDGSKKNLTGHTFVAWMKKTYGDDSSEAVKFSTSVLSPPTNGKVALKLTNTQTDLLDTKRRYVFDVEMNYQDSDMNDLVERILQGTATVSPSATK